MRYLTLKELFELHRLVIAQSGGSLGLRNQGLLESAVAQPAMAFNQADLYPTLALKVAALGYSLIQNHPFVDGNKRVGHSAMETMLVLNGHELNVSTDAQEEAILAVASGQMSRETLAQWIELNLKELNKPEKP